MTRAEIDRRIEALAAERVMGWAGWEKLWIFGNFYPITSIADAFALLEAHPEWRWLISWDGEVYPVSVVADSIPSHADERELPRAITYACLRAVGASDGLDALLRS